jgi:O-methyltransferase involved in polyketide biosynthesis
MKIHETAFVTCANRSSDEKLSGDPYAKLWSNKTTEKWVQSVIEEVSPYEPFLHCLRNRFFLVSIQKFFTKNPRGVLVNMGAGFSMYPFVISSNIECLDIDQQDVISYKKSQCDNWIKDGFLPMREIEYMNLDFRMEDHSCFIQQVIKWIAGRPSFIILEGVLYFLSENVTNRLFTTFKEIQNPGDILGCVSFLPESKDTDVQIRLDDFFDRNNFTQDSFSHQLLSNESYESRDGYRVVDHKDYCDLSKLFTSERQIEDRFSILNENMYLLKRI